VNRFVAIATSDFLRFPLLSRLPPRARRLTLIFTGFVALPNGSLPSYVLVSNFQDFETYEDSDEAWPEFRMFAAEANPEPKIVANIQRIGAYREIGPNEYEPLRAMILAGAPAIGVVQKNGRHDTRCVASSVLRWDHRRKRSLVHCASGIRPRNSEWILCSQSRLHLLHARLSVRN